MFVVWGLFGVVEGGTIFFTFFGVGVLIISSLYSDGFS